MSRALVISLALLALASPASAQDSLLVVVIDPGETQIDQRATRRAIGQALSRTAIRMSDERAQSAGGRLTIAFSRPDRWVLRYEAGGQVAWVSDRVRNPRALRRRLAELSRDLVARVEHADEAPREDWGDVILALRDEIVDPFEDDPPRRERSRPVTVLWSEVVDPFAEGSNGSRGPQVWTEVLDPWATEVRRSGR